MAESANLPDSTAAFAELSELAVSTRPLTEILRRTATLTREAAAGHGVMLGICLPRDEFSVPVIRCLVGHALEQVGVVEGVRGDILLALSEACTNVLDHAGPGDAYQVAVTIGPDRCELRVVDVGRGYDHASVVAPSGSDADLAAERGRGLGLMRALVDHLELVSEPEEGTLVRLVKQLAFDETTPVRRLLFQALHGGVRAVAGPEPCPSDQRQPPA